MLCSDCKRPMRPNKASASDYPGTIQHVGMGVCRTCHDQTVRKLKASRRKQQEASPAPAPDYATFTPPGLRDADPKVRRHAQSLVDYLQLLRKQRQEKTS